MSGRLRISRWKPRPPGGAEVIDYRALGWLMRRVAVWQTLFGWWPPWMKPGVAGLFLDKNWKALECAARREFAHDVMKRWHA